MNKLLLAGVVCLSFLVWACPGSRDQEGETASSSPPSSRYVRPPGKARAFVFVHGILGDSRDTWTHPNGIYFPDLLVEDPELPPGDVYVYDFPTRLQSKGPLSITEIAASMRNRLIKDRVFEDHEQVVFVAHSMGGLVAIQFLLNYRELAPKVPLVVLYSTPQGGAEITRLASLVSDSRQVAAMLPGEANLYLESLDRQWRNSQFGTTVRCAYERRSFKSVLVVGRDSATRLCDGDTVPVDADHSGIVKPENRDADSYIALFNWVRELPEPVPPEPASPRQAIDSVEGAASFQTPGPLPLSRLVDLLEENKGVTIPFVGCDEPVLSAVVPRSTYSGANMKELLENIRLRIESQDVRYTVHVVREGVRYEIRCQKGVSLEAADQTLAELVGQLEKSEGVRIALVGCEEWIRSAMVPRGRYSGETTKELLENMRLRMEAQGFRYQVHVAKEGESYEIRCE